MIGIKLYFITTKTNDKDPNPIVKGFNTPLLFKAGIILNAINTINNPIHKATSIHKT